MNLFFCTWLVELARLAGARSWFAVSCNNFILSSSEPSWYNKPKPLEITSNCIWSHFRKTNFRISSCSQRIVSSCLSHSHVLRWRLSSWENPLRAVVSVCVEVGLADQQAEPQFAVCSARGELRGLQDGATAASSAECLATGRCAVAAEVHGVSILATRPPGSLGSPHPRLPGT